MNFLNDIAIQQVIRNTGMDYLQASNSVKQRNLLAASPVRFPLGRTSSIDHDAEYADWAARYPELAASHTQVNSIF